MPILFLTFFFSLSSYAIPLLPGLEGKLLSRSDEKKLRDFQVVLFEGRELVGYCKRQISVNYHSVWQRQQAKRTMMSGLQAYGLDLVIPKLKTYAKGLYEDKEAWIKASENLVNGSCSPNITIMGHKLIKRKLLEGMEFKSSEDKEQLDRNFERSAEIFRALCSWGGKIEDPRLLATFLKDPYVMGYVISKLSREKIIYSSSKQRFITEYDNQTLPVSCNGLICRKGSEEKFDLLMPRAYGSLSVKEDLRRLYCGDFKQLPRFPKTENELTTKWVKEQTLDSQKIMIDYFISLATKGESLFAKINNFSEVSKSLTSSMDSSMTFWLESALNIEPKDASFEEALNISVANDNTDWSVLSDEHFKLQLNVNLGEFDRAYAKIGKVKASHRVFLDKNFLAGVAKIWREKFDTPQRILDASRKNFYHHLRHQLDDFKNVTIFKGKLDALTYIIGDELIERIRRVKGEFTQTAKRELVPIDIDVYFGIFALDYMYKRHLAFYGKDD